MNTEQQRITIAEACGWTCIERINRFSYGGLRGVDPTGESKIIPSYLTDLNAMHTAIERLPFDQQITVAELLTGDLVEVMQATAAKRAEAFLKTINKWKND